MKKLITVFALILVSQLLSAQLNMQLVGERSYGIELNDVWAWVAPDGTEYALVGTTQGVSIVSLADPANPLEVAFVGGPSSTWRDIKTWKNYAYVSNENSGGIQIIDLGGLPQTVRDTFWTVESDGRVLDNIHNLYIDSVGYCYVAGSNLNRGGPLVVDVDIDPWDPDLVGLGANIYVHDIYVRDDLLYASELNEGRMAIYDISDKTDFLLLGTQNTPYNFTHNIWLSDDGTVAFTTDERQTAPVAAYNVSDPTNIQELDQFRPAATLAQGNIPHNVHVWRDWLILSYYGDGGIIVDASRPQNLVEVGNFDTFFNLDPGQGAWGAYPFLPSGLVLVTDIGNGLFVLEPNYVRAAWLEGKVTDALSGAPINGVRVEIISDQPNIESSDLSGNYKTGQALAGTFEVRFFKEGYFPKTVSATLENGQLTILDVELGQASRHQISGITLRDQGGAVIEGAQVLLEGEQGNFLELTGPNGFFQLENVYQGNYQLYVGKWGYLPEAIGSIQVKKDTAITVNLRSGYQDDFLFDFGWKSTSQGENVTGKWVRGEPRGTSRDNGDIVNPGSDIEEDIGNRCFQTGNGGGAAGTDDVDNGTVTLISPVMDLKDYLDPVLTYHAWFYNSGGNSPLDDSLLIQITNGIDTVTLENLQSDESGSTWRPEASFHLRDYIELTDSMQLLAITADLEPNGHLVEAALDYVRVREAEVINGVEDDELTNLQFNLFPNPFREYVQLDLSDLINYSELQVRVFNQLGQQLLQAEIPAGTAIHRIPTESWASGTYFVQLIVSGQAAKTLKIVKPE